MDEAKLVKIDSSVAHSRSTDNLTTPSSDSEKVLIGHHVPMDVKIDRSNDDNVDSDKIEDDKKIKGLFNNDLLEKRNWKTFFVIAFVTVFIIAGLSTKFTNKASIATLDTSDNSAAQISAEAVTSESTPDNKIGSLSEILSSRISLVSSKNPKFIITAEGKKIVPSDILIGGLTVVDIYSDHVVVALENGETRNIDY